MAAIVTKISLKVSKTTFSLLIGATNSIAVFLSALLPHYLPEAAVGPVITFIDSMSNIIIIYLSTEESQVIMVPKNE